MGSPVPVSFFFSSFFFLMAGGVVELSGGSPQRPPSLPAIGNKRGIFSEEHSDVGGGCECGPCVRAAAAAAAPFVLFPSTTLVPVQSSRIIQM